MARFRQSALASARLDHLNIVRVLAEGIDDMGPFIVSAWVETVPLSAGHKQVLPWGFLQSVLLQICDALADVHACTSGVDGR